MVLVTQIPGELSRSKDNSTVTAPSGKPNKPGMLSPKLTASSPPLLNRWVQLPELDAGIRGGKLPLHTHLPLVALLLPGLDLLRHKSQ